MDTREWLFVSGVIAVVAIALILAARWRRQRFDDIRSGEHLSVSNGDVFASNELPGGGARTVGYRDPGDIERMNDEIRARAKASRPGLSAFRPEPVVQRSLLDDVENQDSGQEAIPLLLDPSDEHNLDESPGGESPGPAVQDSGQIDRAESARVANSRHLGESESLADDLQEPGAEPELRVKRDDQPAHIKTASKSQSDKQKVATRSARPVKKKSGATRDQAPGEIVVINLMTEPNSPYEGANLLKLALELGLRHGDMNIFHYCGRHGDEPPQFRMANLLRPGYFDIDNMENTRTHALCFFFELMPDQDNMKVYDAMLSVINKLRDGLGGELHDENRSVFTIQTSEHCRNRIRDFRRRNLPAR